MERILHVYPQLNNAGTEMVIMNLYRNIDRDLVQFDFLVQKKGLIDDTILSMGGKIYYLPYTKGYAKELAAFFRTHPEYGTVHTHTHKEMGLVLKAAAKARVKRRIAHSHNSRADLPKLVKLYKMWTSRHIEKFSTHFLACSDEAAKWLFPSKYRNAVVWNNAIELDRFLFNKEKREEYRQRLGIKSADKVICHVGRFADQKNHRQMITWLNDLTKEDLNLHAILVGTGPLFNEIKEMANNDRIHFLGNRTDVPQILCAADVFLFPSLFEGLGIVAVEAQASGLPCLASTGVPAAADIGIDLFEQISLTESQNAWKSKIKDLLEWNQDLDRRFLNSQKALSTQYDIRQVAKAAQEFYLQNE